MFLTGLIAGIVLFVVIDLASIGYYNYRIRKEQKIQKEFMKEFLSGLL